MKVSAPAHTNSLRVTATPAEHQKVKQLIGSIDGGTGGGVEVFRLTRSVPIVMSEMLNSLFENEGRGDRPVITPDLWNTALVVRAASSQMAELKKTLASFCESTGVSRPARRSG